MKLSDLWIVMAMPVHGDSMPAGQYDNSLREPYEVFELLNLASGEFPRRERPVFKTIDRLDPKSGLMQKYISQEVERMDPWNLPNGEPAHRDFSDFDEEWRGAGNEFGGDAYRGWMRRVSPELVLQYGLDRDESGLLPICGIYFPDHELVQKILTGAVTAPVRRPPLEHAIERGKPYQARSRGPVNRPLRGTQGRIPNQRPARPETA